MKRIWPIYATLLMGASVQLAANEIEMAQFEQAKQCISEPARLKRLACFDSAMGTSLSVSKKENDYFFMPEMWQRAVDNQAQRTTRDGFFVHQKDEKDRNGDLWMTLFAQPNDKYRKQKPILMFSCIDNITRVELVLPKPNLARKAKITTDNRNPITQEWLSDEQGLLFRTGRGLQAIDVIKSFMSSSTTYLRSDLDAINGLQFDTLNLKKSIIPLREACRW